MPPATPTRHSPDAALIQLRFPFSVWDHRAEKNPANDPITSGYIYSWQLEEFMDANKYKVGRPVLRTEWYQSRDDDDTGPPSDPSAIVIGGRVRDGRIQFTFRYMDDDKWVLAEDLDILNKRMVGTVADLGYLCYYGTNNRQMPDSIMLPFSRFLGDVIWIDNRYELPHASDTNVCPCGCIPEYKSEMEWVGCDSCGRWWHQACCKQDTSGDTYKCDLCMDENWKPEGSLEVVLSKNNYCNTAPAKTMYSINKEEEENDEEIDNADGDDEQTAFVGQKRKLIAPDDGLGSCKRGPGRMKDSEFFHSHYGRLSHAEYEVGTHISHSPIMS